MGYMELLGDILGGSARHITDGCDPKEVRQVRKIGQMMNLGNRAAADDAHANRYHACLLLVDG
jgi:hypothetical protein